MRIQFLNRITMALVLGAAACGDDDTSNANGSNSGVHGGNGNDQVGFTSPEGGEVRWEFMDFGGGVEAVRLTAFFKAAQDPDFIPFVPEGECTEITDSNPLWPLEPSDPSNTTYYNVGNLRVGGMPQATEVQPIIGGQPDPFFRSHDVYYFTFLSNIDLATGMDTGIDISELIAPARTYNVEVEGNADYAPWRINAELRIPGRYPVPDAMDTANMEIQAGQDLPLPFNDEDDGFNDPVIPFVVIANSAQETTHVCLGNPDEDTVVVDAATTQNMPDEGFLLHATSIHRVVPLPDENGEDTDRRLDLLGLWCYLRPFTKVQ
ncbi:MAG TPA: hypothetical protein RMG48_15970 [Myxococcales bacterium LLY-WYZ-16_1]|nr:hypothetical protein [Myxococcales bacterium LLY-WYZ-16_1]